MLHEPDKEEMNSLQLTVQIFASLADGPEK